jgi:HEPN domain-containing protein
MDSPQNIQQIAYLRIAEARVLYANGMYDGAFYLAGYSVELMLKAKICERFCMPNLLDEDCKEVNCIEGINDIRRVVKTHNLITLLIISGLKCKYEGEMALNPVFTTMMELVFRKWSESARYNLVGTAQREDVEKIIALLGGDNNFNGLLLWIEKN